MEIQKYWALITILSHIHSAKSFKYRGVYRFRIHNAGLIVISTGFRFHCEYTNWHLSFDCHYLTISVRQLTTLFKTLCTIVN